MQATGGSLIPRVIGAIKLDSATYEEVERDSSAMTQALMVVGVAAVAAAIGGADGGGEGIIGALISSLLGWIVAGVIAYFVGTKILPGANTSTSISEVLRVTGFAYAPTILYVFGFIPVIGAIVVLVAFVLAIIAYVVALRATFDATTGRAIGIAVISWVVALVISIVILAILGISIEVTG